MADLPDFEEMMALIENISALTFKKMAIDAEIKACEGEVIKKVTTDSAYFQSGKPPSMSYISATYAYTGLNNELIEKRILLAKTISELERAKLRFDLLKEQIGVYRTEQANRRYEVV